MAIFHLHVSNGSKAQNKSAKTRFAYVTRTAEFERHPDRALYAESGNMPSWSKSPEDFWQASDDHEAKNGRVYREIEFALPRELSEAQQLKLAQDFAQDVTHYHGLPYTMAIHEGRGHNPHVHMLICERGDDGIERERAQFFKRANSKEPHKGGARKIEELKDKAWIVELRQGWEIQANAALEQARLEPRIDHRSYAAQGIELPPQIHLGVEAAAMARKGIVTERYEQYLKIDEARELYKELQREMKLRQDMLKELHLLRGREASQERQEQAIQAPAELPPTMKLPANWRPPEALSGAPRQEEPSDEGNTDHDPALRAISGEIGQNREGISSSARATRSDEPGHVEAEREGRAARDVSAQDDERAKRAHADLASERGEDGSSSGAGDRAATRSGLEVGAGQPGGATLREGSSGDQSLSQYQNAGGIDAVGKPVGSVEQRVLSVLGDAAVERSNLGGASDPQKSGAEPMRVPSASSVEHRGAPQGQSQEPKQEESEAQMKRLRALLQRSEQALKATALSEERARPLASLNLAQGQSVEQLRAYEVELRMAQLKRQLWERHPEAPEQEPRPGAGRVISDEVYKGERLTMIQQGQGWSLLRGAEAKQLEHQLEGRGAQAKLISRPQDAQLEHGAPVRLSDDLKTLWAHEQRSRERKIELERELRNRQPKRDRGRDR